MKTVELNDDNLTLNDISKFEHKGRAILMQGDMILVASYGGVILLPGGKVDDDKNESSKLALIRELKEETGVDYTLDELTQVLTLRWFQSNYPTRSKDVINRYLETDYFIADFKGIDLNNVHRTEKELKDGFSLKLISIEEFTKTLSVSSDNPRKKFFDKENEMVIDTIRSIGESRGRK